MVPLIHTINPLIHIKASKREWQSLLSFLQGFTPLDLDYEPIAGEQPSMSVLSRLNTDSLLVRQLFISILLLLHVDNALLFHTNFKLFALLSVQNLYSVQCVLLWNMHTLVTLSTEDLSDLSWKFQFKIKYPLLGWFEYFVLHHMIQYMDAA